MTHFSGNYLKQLAPLAIAFIFCFNGNVVSATPEVPPVGDIGWDNGNAGDSVAAEFILSGRDVLQRIEFVNQASGVVFDTENLRAAVKATEVVSEDNLKLDGHERDAVNYYPKKRLIKVNRQRWKDLRRPQETKTRLRLVLHEYLWISGIDDTNYVQSEYLIELLNVKNYSPTVWWNPVNPVNMIQLKLRYASSAECTLSPIRLNPRATEEVSEVSTKGPCGTDARIVRVVKATGVTPPASQIRGYFHRFDVQVLTEAKQVIGEFQFEPEWGSCLLPESGSCRMSGKISVGGVDFTFWYLRD
jgi:hypothetical protein